MTVQNLSALSSVQVVTKPQAVAVNSRAKTTKAPRQKPHESECDLKTKAKTGVILSAIGGIAIAMMTVLKGKYRQAGLNPIKQFVNLFKVTYDEAELPKLVALLGIGSLSGGLIGGAIFDKKENMRAKFRESIIQAVGNIATPLAFVWGGMKFYEHKMEPKLFKEWGEKIVKATTKNAKDKIRKPFMQKSLSFLVSGICLSSGVFIGNKVGNEINKKAFKVDEKRKLKITDMSPHIDDLCMGLSLVGIKGSFGNCIKRVIPLALMISGIETGLAQQHYRNPDLIGDISNFGK